MACNQPERESTHSSLSKPDSLPRGGEFCDLDTGANGISGHIDEKVDQCGSSPASAERTARQQAILAQGLRSWMSRQLLKAALGGQHEKDTALNWASLATESKQAS